MHDSNEKIVVLDSVESTNNYAMSLVKNGEVGHGSAVFAYEQTGGKGRLGRQWITEPGASIHLSLLTRMEWASLAKQFMISVAASLSAIDLIAKYSDSEVFVKWPNDIFINDRKAAGILIENVIRGDLWQWAITGIGLNVNQTNFPLDPELKRTTSLGIETTQKFDVLQLASELRTIFLTYIESWREGLHEQWMERYNSRLYKAGQLVKLEYGNRVFETTITSVTNEGKLVTKDVFEREWDLDQVKIRL